MNPFFSPKSSLQQLHLLLHFHIDGELGPHLVIAAFAQVKAVNLPVLFGKIVPLMIDRNTALPQNALVYNQFLSAAVADYRFQLPVLRVFSHELPSPFF